MSHWIWDDQGMFQLHWQLVQSSIWLHRCWWRMLETKNVVDNFEMLVTVLTVFVIHICYILTSAFGNNIVLVQQPKSNVINIETSSPSLEHCHQHKVINICVAKFDYLKWSRVPLTRDFRTKRPDYDNETYKDRSSHWKSGIIQYENYPRVNTSLDNLIRFQFHFVQSDVRSAVWSTTNAMTKPMLNFWKTDFRNHTNNIASLL